MGNFVFHRKKQNMQLVPDRDYISSSAQEFLEQLGELNLVCFASDAARELEFEDIRELHMAISRAMEICIHAGIPVTGNFRRVFTCSGTTITYDWKLSVLAYRLVCINGSTSNPAVAKQMIQLVKNQPYHINHTSYETL